MGSSIVMMCPSLVWLMALMRQASVVDLPQMCIRDRENADGETYETRIYLYEGALREEYGTADAALDPQDSERIVDAKSFSVEQVRPCLLYTSRCV